MKHYYYNSIVMIERVHRIFLEVLKYELNKLKITDINNVQSIVLYNIGKKKMSVGSLTINGCYLGSNVSYNLRKMVENGYVLQCRHEYDRRSSEVSLTDKGLEMYDRMTNLMEIHAKGIQESNIKEDMINNMIQTISGIEKYLQKVANYQENFK